MPVTTTVLFMGLLPEQTTKRRVHFSGPFLHQDFVVLIDYAH
jgi:hypothetical protein